MTPAETVELVRWIEGQHAQALRACRLLWGEGTAPASWSDADRIRHQLATAAETAAASARLEMWNDMKAGLAEALRTGTIPARWMPQ